MKMLSTQWMLGAVVTTAIAMTTGCVADATDEETDESSAALSSKVRVETQLTKVGTNEGERALLTRIIKMIDGVPSGQTIRVALHSIDDLDVIGNRGVIDALDKAKNERNVTVKVVQNGAARDSENARTLARKLKDSHKFCGTQANGGCISKAAGSIMHSKLFLFTKTTDDSGALRSNVTWFGSANMTEKTGAGTWNNAVAVYDDDKLHDAMVGRYFAKLWNEEAAGAPFYDANSSGKGLVDSSDSGTTVWASPHPQGDLVAARLAGVHPSPGCEVMISQNMIHKSRPAILAQLARIADKSKAKHCNVRVLVNHYDSDNTVLRTLANANIKARFSKTHDKMFLIDAKVDCGNGCENAPRRKLVFTGSHNWTGEANDINDELLVRIENPPVYTKLVEHFDRQWEKNLGF